MNYEDWEFHPSKLPKDFFELSNVLKELEAKFLQELKENQKLKEYLKPYDAKWANLFIERYASYKVQAVQHSKYAIERADKDRELRYREETQKVFNVILQKKLFNLQMLWRAEKVNIPEIRTSWDFIYWGDNIDKCTFLDPVSDGEVDAMRQFLQSNNYDINTRYWLHGEQDYEELTEKDENGDYPNMPEWYEFYDGVMGTGALLHLPDARVPKQEFYRELGMKEANKIRMAELAKNPPAPYVPAPPSIHCSLEERSYVASLIDDEVFQCIFQADLDDYKERCEAEEENYFDIEMAIINLEKVKNPPPVRGGIGWREAIYRCWQDYLNAIIAEDLDLVYEEYKFYGEMGLSSSKCAEETINYLGDDVAKQVLRGRELCGEPRDFNY